MLKRIAAALMPVAVAVMAACGSSSGLNDNDDCDYIIAVQAGDTLPDTTNRCVAGPLAIDFEINVFFRAPGQEEGGVGEAPEPTVNALFRLKYYDISYHNLDNGGSQPGVDVPYPTRVSIEALFDMTEEEELTLTGFEILEAGAKQEPPLNQDAFYTQASGVPLRALLTFWGYPINDPDKWCFSQMEWYFTVFSSGC